MDCTIDFVMSAIMNNTLNNPQKNAFFSEIIEMQYDDIFGKMYSVRPI